MWGMKKECTACGVIKPLTEFAVDKRAKDGRYSRCGSCHYKSNKDYQKRWREKNKEKWQKYMQSYYKEWEKENKEKRNAYRRRWKKTPVGKQANLRSQFKRRSYLKEAVCDLSLKDWEDIIQEQKNRCNMCNLLFTEEAEPTQDHIHPVSKGGHHTKDNIQALCLSCNVAKGNKTE